jgi:hypothetical protein
VSSTEAAKAFTPRTVETIQPTGELPIVGTAFAPIVAPFQSTTVVTMDGFGETRTTGKSGYETFLDVNYRSRLPDVAPVEKGLAVMDTALLSSPLQIGRAGPAFGSMILQEGGKRAGISPELLKTQKEQSDFARGLTGTFEGQYKLAYENPELAAVSYAGGAVFGLGARGAGAIASRSATLTKAAPYVSSYGGAVLGGLYVGGTTYEQTKGFTDISRTTGAGTKAMLFQGGVPMAMGYNTPNQIIRRARLSDIGYKSAVQEGLVTSRAEYYTPIPRMVQRAKLEVPQFIEESGGNSARGVGNYVQYKVGNAYQSKIGIPLGSAIQEAPGSIQRAGVALQMPFIRTKVEGVPKLQAALASKYIDIAYGQPSIPTRNPTVPSTKPMVSKLPSAPAVSRMDTKIVGGKVVSGLAREPSMKSMGSVEKSSSFSSGPSIGTRTDFRGKSGAMKPMDYKRAESQQAILSEQLPEVEGMTVGKMQGQAPQIVSVIRFAPTQSFDVMMETKPIFATSQQSLMMTQRGTLQSEGQMFERESSRKSKSEVVQFVKTERISSVARESAIGRVPITSMRTGVDVMPTTANIVGQDIGRTNRQDLRTGFETRTIQNPEIIPKAPQRPFAKAPQRPFAVPTATPTFVPPTLLPGSGRGSPYYGSRYRSTTATYRVGADLLGASRGSFSPMRMPKRKPFRMPKF